METVQGALLPFVVLDQGNLSVAPEDALIRALDGLDINDFRLFASALVRSTVLQIDDKEYRGVDAITREYFNPVSLLHTTHFATNIRVARKGSRLAELSAKVLAQDYSFLSNPQAGSSPPHLLSGSFHRVTLTLPPGQNWRISHWVIRTVWSAPTVPELREPQEPPPPDYEA